ncbi:hypothetical protein MUN76_09745 [Leucobacter rhizosphaerae]|uniref:VWFA domain-containing protein n=1 Tax=Leucobacter rhizosphaerae TaxID=2932245 RepID=A0ABY4FSV3_9MICO|nr:hypothetical protein [Leucobacter rhizosphaerae]UOQ59341.1 hypothetical protein MUN76_09745 [Leucobacter rhizosphaerae]
MGSAGEHFGARSGRRRRTGRRAFGLAALVLTPALAFGMTFTDLGTIVAAQAVDEPATIAPTPPSDVQVAQETPAPPTETPPAEEPTEVTPTPAPPVEEPTPAEEPTEPPTETPAEPPVEPEEPATDPTAKPAPDAKDATEELVTPLSIPAPTDTTAVITVKVGGIRTTVTQVSNLAGVTLQLYNGGSGGPDPSPRPEPWATCVSDADGDCSFTIPDTQRRSGSTPAGVNRDARFWIKQAGVPNGYFMNATLATGENPSSATYQFRTGEDLQAGNTYSSQADFMYATGNSSNNASGGIWQQSRTNPVFTDRCGIRVAMIVDLSGSVSPYISQLRTAAKGFVDALTGTPSSMALFTFASGAPAGGGSNLDVTGIATPAGATTVKNRIDTYTASGGTNWDRGIFQAAASAAQFDVAIVLTDGNPTLYAGGEGPGDRTRFREVENGIFSANALKAKNTKVIAFGVGDGVSGSPANLRAISGTTAGVDYYQSADYAAAGATLRQLALGNCAGSVSVVKQVVPSTNTGENISGAVPASGWGFTAATATPGVTPATQSGSTDGTGAVNFPLTYTAGTSSAAVNIAEAQQPGYSIVTQAGKRAVCKIVGSGAAVTVTNDPGNPNGFSVDAPAAAPVTCTVYNRPPLPQASITVNKTWVVNGTTYTDGDQPIGIGAQLQLGGTDQAWGTPRDGLTVGSSLQVSEQMRFVGRDLCTLTSQGITAKDGQPFEAALPFTAPIDATHTYTVTNVVTCTAELTLVKQVQNGDADPTSWTLDAVAPGGALPGPNGTTGTPSATAPVTPGVSYPLAESGGDPRYLQSIGLNGNPQSPSTGSWACVQLDAQGQVVPGFSDGLNGAVIVPLGFKVRCTAVNRTATLTLAKEVVNDHGGTRVPSDWDLTATPTGEFPAGLEPETVTGDADGRSFSVRPGTPYALTETALAGYTLGSLKCDTGPGGSLVDATTVTVPALGHTTCVFVNEDQGATLTLVKVVEQGSSGATTPASAWTLTASGPNDTVTGAGNSPEVTNQSVDAGTYALSESATPGGYTASDWSCTGASESDGASVTLVPGSNATCTITNTAVKPTLTLQKDVENAHGGSRSATEFPLTASGPTTVSGISGTPEVTTVAVPIGAYTLSETNPDPLGYAFDELTCTNRGTPLGTDLEDPTATLTLGDAVVCTYTNVDRPATLTLIKDVDAGESGSTREPADWTLTADPDGIEGQDPVSGNGTGVESEGGVEAVTVFAGDYTLSEEGPAGFDAGDWVCEGGVVDDDRVTVPNGGNVICTITNTAVSPRLTLIKVVDNGTTGGDSTPADWALTGEGPTPITGYTGDPSITDAPVQVGTYDLSEVGTDVGYTEGPWVCVGGVQMNEFITLAEGDDVTCTITNTAVESSWTISKHSTPASGSTVLPGELIEYTLTATHTGGVQPVDVVITDDLSDVLDDAELEGTPSATVGTAALTGTTLEWTMDTFSGTATATYTVRVDEDAYNATLHNVVTPPKGSTCEGDCETTHSTPGWRLTKSSDPVSGSVVDPSSTVEYTLHALNTSGATVSGATAIDDLSDVLDDAVLLQPLPAGLTYDPEAQELRWDIPTLAPGDPEATISYSVIVNADAYGKVIANVVTPGTPGGECPVTTPDLLEPTRSAIEIDDDCDTTVRVRDVNLAIAKSHAPIPEGAVDSGKDEVIDYTLLVSNIGVDAATEVTVTDTLPAGLSYVEGTLVAPAGWTAEFVDGVFTATFPGPFAAGDTAEFTFDALVGTLSRPSDAEPFPAIENTACVSEGEPDTDPSDNCATDTTPVKSIAVTADAVCIADTPYASYTVTPFNVSADPWIALIWWTPAAYADRDPSISADDTAALLADGASQVDRIEMPVGWTSGTPIEGQILWPGAEVDAAGNPIAWPGWTQRADGTWVLDPDAPFYDLRAEAVMEIRINPSSDSQLVYPPATPNCNPAPPENPPHPTPAPTPRGLVTTGSELAPLVATGIGLLALGAALGIVALRRRHRRSRGV